MSTRNDLSVREQFSGKRILMTGTTGFLGKVVIEKIIRERLNIDGIVLLIRGSDRHATARERFDREIAVSTVFDRLKDESPAYFRQFCRDKIDCVTGEVTEKYFGLSRENFLRLAGRVDLVIHAAASVDFREQLQQALKVNALSLLNMADLIKAAGNIPLVHVSTCYVNGFNRGHCREEVVKPVSRAFQRNAKGFYHVGPHLAEMLGKIGEIRATCPQPDRLARRMVELGVKVSHRYGWNDTYSFTKWLGEQIAMETLADSTLTIVRPAIIESTYQEPVPGWVEGVKVADAIILAYAREKTPFFPARGKGIIDIVPAELAANSLILAAAEALAMPGRHRIYQCSSGSVNPITVSRFRDLLQSEVNRNVAAYDRLFRKGKPKRNFRLVDRRIFVIAMTVLRLAVEAYSGICRLTGMTNRIPKITDFVNTTMKLAVTFSFYASPYCIFHNDRLRDLVSRVTLSERGAFPVDAGIIQWERYLGAVHLGGLNRYALKGREVARNQTATPAEVPHAMKIPVTAGSLKHGKA